MGKIDGFMQPWQLGVIYTALFVPLTPHANITADPRARRVLIHAYAFGANRFDLFPRWIHAAREQNKTLLIFSICCLSRVTNQLVVKVLTRVSGCAVTYRSAGCRDGDGRGNVLWLLIAGGGKNKTKQETSEMYPHRLIHGMNYIRSHPF